MERIIGVRAENTIKKLLKKKVGLGLKDYGYTPLGNFFWFIRRDPKSIRKDCEGFQQCGEETVAEVLEFQKLLRRIF